MIDVFDIAALFVDLVRREAPDDIALIAYYGSYATGTATPHSDLDLYYIPDEGKESAMFDKLYRSVICQGRPFEFWPVSWDFAERIANGQHHWGVAPSIIANARVLYARSDADEERFAALQAKIAERQQPEHRGTLIRQAQDAFQPAAGALYRLELAAAQNDATGARWVCVQLIDALIDALALVNQTFLTKNWASDIMQLETLAIQPDDLPARIETLLTSPDLAQVCAAAHDLTGDVRAIIIEQTRTLRDDATLKDMFTGYYPAIQEYANKILTACARGNWINASAVAAQMQKELAFMLAYGVDGVPYSEFNVFVEYRATLDRLGFPDLAPAINARDADQLAALTRAFLHAARAYFEQHAIPLHSAETLDDLRHIIDNNA